MDDLQRTGASREDYADLFEAIGETFGDGNGITTFNLPDCRGVAVRGYDNGRGYDSGRKFGSYQADQMQTHTHGVPGVQSFCSGAAATSAFIMRATRRLRRISRLRATLRDGPAAKRG